jgi:hypothetical protein
MRHSHRPEPTSPGRTPRRPRLIPIAALVALGVIPAACATTGAPPEPVATLVVENDSPMQVNIHAQREGTRIRVGTVPGITTREFPLRRDMLSPAGDLHLVIGPVGSPRSYPAMPINVRDGDTIELRVGAVIR